MLNYYFLVRMENLCKMSNYYFVISLRKCLNSFCFALHTRERKVSRAHLCKVFTVIIISMFFFAPEFVVALILPVSKSCAHFQKG